ncbi:MAG: DUF58 domain-containing protein [Bacteroidales bacterium]|nr:DUF58 domain-containing protein [Candidatus Colimorpha pelethequi]MCQ2262227.1 DUF58 domain-containing protein [Bacteroidales bacterium]
MEQDSEIIKKVRKIEIKARGLSRQLFSGEYHSAFKGRGMAFSEVREYQYGDDVRSIDWNVTARLNHPYVKIFEEERELTVMLLVDTSGSNHFGTNHQFKEELVAEVAATIAFSAIQNNDKVGVIFFSDHIEKFIPPKKGRTHILRIIRELITFQPESNGTNLTEALRYFTNVIKKRCTAFLLSDFYDENYSDALKIAANKHDLVAVRITDEKEQQLPNLGLAKFYDPESGQTIWVDTASKQTRDEFANAYEQHRKRTDETLKKYGIDQTELYTGEDFVKPLMKLFRMR